MLATEQVVLLGHCWVNGLAAEYRDGSSIAVEPSCSRPQSSRRVSAGASIRAGSTSAACNISSRLVLGARDGIQLTVNSTRARGISRSAPLPEPQAAFLELPTGRDVSPEDSGWRCLTLPLYRGASSAVPLLRGSGKLRGGTRLSSWLAASRFPSPSPSSTVGSPSQAAKPAAVQLAQPTAHVIAADAAHWSHQPSLLGIREHLPQTPAEQKAEPLPTPPLAPLRAALPQRMSSHWSFSAHAAPASPQPECVACQATPRTRTMRHSFISSPASGLRESEGVLTGATITVEFRILWIASDQAQLPEYEVERLAPWAHTYAHGGFMGLAPSLVADSRWQDILLEAEGHRGPLGRGLKAGLRRSLARSASSRRQPGPAHKQLAMLNWLDSMSGRAMLALMTLLENSPVLCAYGLFRAGCTTRTVDKPPGATALASSEQSGQHSAPAAQPPQAQVHDSCAASVSSPPAHGAGNAVLQCGEADPVPPQLRPLPPWVYAQAASSPSGQVVVALPLALQQASACLSAASSRQGHEGSVVTSAAVKSGDSGSSGRKDTIGGGGGGGSGGGFDGGESNGGPVSSANRYGYRPICLEWDLWLSPDCPSDLQKANVDHGSVGHLLSQAALTAVGCSQLARCAGHDHNQRHGISPLQWLRTFGAALNRGVHGDEAVPLPLGCEPPSPADPLQAPQEATPSCCAEPLRSAAHSQAEPVPAAAELPGSPPPAAAAASQASGGREPPPGLPSSGEDRDSSAAALQHFLRIVPLRLQVEGLPGWLSSTRLEARVRVVGNRLASASVSSMPFLVHGEGGAVTAPFHKPCQQGAPHCGGMCGLGPLKPLEHEDDEACGGDGASHHTGLYPVDEDLSLSDLVIEIVERDVLGGHRSIGSANVPLIAVAGLRGCGKATLSGDIAWRTFIDLLRLRAPTKVTPSHGSAELPCGLAPVIEASANSTAQTPRSDTDTKQGEEMPWRHRAQAAGRPPLAEGTERSATTDGIELCVSSVCRPDPPALWSVPAALQPPSPQAMPARGSSVGHMPLASVMSARAVLEMTPRGCPPSSSQRIAGRLTWSQSLRSSTSAALAGISRLASPAAAGSSPMLPGSGRAWDSRLARTRGSFRHPSDSSNSSDSSDDCSNDSSCSSIRAEDDEIFSQARAATMADAAAAAVGTVTTAAAAMAMIGVSPEHTALVADAEHDAFATTNNHQVLSWGAPSAMLHELCDDQPCRVVVTVSVERLSVLDAAERLLGLPRHLAQSCTAMLSEPGGLYLDVKSAYSRPRHLLQFVSALEGFGIHVKAVCSFSPAQLAFHIPRQPRRRIQNVVASAAATLAVRGGALVSKHLAQGSSAAVSAVARHSAWWRPGETASSPPHGADSAPASTCVAPPCTGPPAAPLADAPCESAATSAAGEGWRQRQQRRTRQPKAPTAMRGRTAAAAAAVAEAVVVSDKGSAGRPSGQPLHMDPGRETAGATAGAGDVHINTSPVAPAPPAACPRALSFDSILFFHGIYGLENACEAGQVPAGQCVLFNGASLLRGEGNAASRMFAKGTMVSEALAGQQRQQVKAHPGWFPLWSMGGDSCARRWWHPQNEALTAADAGAVRASAATAAAQPCLPGASPHNGDAGASTGDASAAGATASYADTDGAPAASGLGRPAATPGSSALSGGCQQDQFGALADLVDLDAWRRYCTLVEQHRIYGGIYVQEPDACPAAIQVLAHLTNTRRAFLPLGFAYGHLSGKAVSVPGHTGRGFASQQLLEEWNAQKHLSKQVQQSIRLGQLQGASPAAYLSWGRRLLHTHQPLWRHEQATLLQLLADCPQERLPVLLDDLGGLEMIFFRFFRHYEATVPFTFAEQRFNLNYTKPLLRLLRNRGALAALPVRRKAVLAHALVTQRELQGLMHRLGRCLLHKLAREFLACLLESCTGEEFLEVMTHAGGQALVRRSLVGWTGSSWHYWHRVQDAERVHARLGPQELPYLHTKYGYKMYARQVQPGEMDVTTDPRHTRDKSSWVRAGRFARKAVCCSAAAIFHLTLLDITLCFYGIWFFPVVLSPYFRGIRYSVLVIALIISCVAAVAVVYRHNTSIFLPLHAITHPGPL